MALNGRPVRPAARLAAGDAVEVLLPIGPPPPAPVPQEVAFAVLYEDEHLLAIDKPAGLVVHPSPGHREVTVLHGLLWRWQQAGEEGEPHLVQRLDRGTSGVLLVAKRGEVHAALSRLLSEPSARKEYLACVYGRPRLERGRIDLAIGLDPTDRRRRVAAVAEGRPSTTFYREIAVSQGEQVRAWRCSAAGWAPAGRTRSGSTSRRWACRWSAIRCTARRAGTGSPIPTSPSAVGASHGRRSTPGGWRFPTR